MPVAKSYQTLTQICEPYKKNNRMYVRVRQASGAEKEVRWYSELEYEKMYPDDPVEKTTRIRSVKDVLGFEKGYITIFKGDIAPVEEWFQLEPRCRYHTLWGWYTISTEEVPDLPAGVFAVCLPWDAISLADGTLKPPAAITEVVEELINEPSSSHWQGSVGERIDRILTVIKIVPIEGYFGSSNFYLFTDADENEYCWTTAAKQLELSSTYEIRGTVKDLSRYKGKEQTILTRCKILDKLN